VVLELPPDKKRLTVTAFDPLKGRGKVLRSIEKDPSDFYSSALSPDGSTLAIARTGSRSEGAEIHIRFLSLSGRSDREIRVKGWPELSWNRPYWSPDGKGLYYSSRSPQGHTLLYVDLPGNAKVLWQFKGSGFDSIWGIPSPDLRHLAIQSETMNSNVWMLEGF
jgi:Tol biopolymer transport system component